MNELSTFPYDISLTNCTSWEETKEINLKATTQKKTHNRRLFVVDETDVKTELRVI